MFDLEQQIRQWRQSSAAALGGSAETIEELESHLRDAVQRLVQSGQKPDEAWEIALRQLGTPQELAGEFDKLTPRPTVWLPARIIALLLGGGACLLAGLLLGRLGQGNMDLLLASHTFAVTVGYGGVFAFGALSIYALVARAVRGWEQGQAATLRYYAYRLTLAGFVLTATGVALGAWSARDHLGRLWAWDLKEIGGLAVLAWYGLMLVWLPRRRSGGTETMLAGLGGNVVVSLSWFGASLLAQVWLASFITLQILLVLLALVRPHALEHRT